MSNSHSDELSLDPTHHLPTKPFDLYEALFNPRLIVFELDRRGVNASLSSDKRSLVVDFDDGDTFAFPLSGDTVIGLEDAYEELRLIDESDR